MWILLSSWKSFTPVVHLFPFPFHLDLIITFLENKNQLQCWKHRWAYSHILFLQPLLLVWVQDGAEDGRQSTYTGYEFTPILYSSSSTDFIAAAPDLRLCNQGQNQVPVLSLLLAGSSGAAVLGWVCLLRPSLFWLAFREGREPCWEHAKSVLCG